MIPNFSKRITAIGVALDTWSDILVRWSAVGTSTTISTFGASSLTITGTAISVSSGAGTLYNRIRKIESLVTVAAVNAVAGWRSSLATWSVGGADARTGGFTCRMRAGPATGVSTATSRFFMGMRNSLAAPTDVEPSSLTDIIGIGYDSADTNVQLMHRGAGAVTKIDLGSNFPVPVLDRTKLYQLVLFSPPGTTQTVEYSVTDIITGSVVTGALSTNLPTTGTLLCPIVWSSVGGTSSVIGVHMSDIEVSTTY